MSGDEKSSTQRFVNAIRELVGDISLNGFQDEEEVVSILNKALEPTIPEVQKERELLAA